MIINAVVDRIENGNAILLSNEAEIEISIPLDTIKGKCSKGDRISLILDNQGNNLVWEN